jgi:hypothetical protein
MIDLADDDESPDADASLFHVLTILSVVFPPPERLSLQLRT